MNISDLFEEYDDDYIKFELIPENQRRHPRPDICAFIYLHEKLGGSGDAVSAAGHDEIWLDWDEKDLEKLTKEDIQYLVRCGVRYDSDTESLAMYV